MVQSVPCSIVRTSTCRKAGKEEMIGEKKDRESEGIFLVKLEFYTSPLVEVHFSAANSALFSACLKTDSFTTCKMMIVLRERYS